MKNRIARGAHLLVWSKNGAPWARAALRAVGFGPNPQITILSKPIGYMDDKPCQDWMGDHIFLPPDDFYS